MRFFLMGLITENVLQDLYDAQVTSRHESIIQYFAFICAVLTGMPSNIFPNIWMLVSEK